jgi:gliding motility-associated-like protein
VNPVEIIDNEIMFCKGDSIYVSGEYQTQPGIYSDTLTTAMGCDSIIRTSISFYPSEIMQKALSICAGESVLIGGVFATESGIYFDTLISQNGCDSIIQTKLTVNKIEKAQQFITICQGEGVLIAGEYHTEPGIYLDSLTSINGCDSIVSYVLSVLPGFYSEKAYSICEGDSVFAGGAYQTTSGTYLDYYNSLSGCDSIVTNIITVSPLPVSDFYMTEDGPGDLNFQCFDLSQNASSWIWYFGDGQTSTEANPIHDYSNFDTYTVKLIVKNGCGIDTSIQILALEAKYDFYNAFSPNNDGKNDHWEIPVMDYYPDNQVTIINRWGVVVWKTEDYNNISNRFIGENMDGEKLGDGTYFYILEYDRTEQRGWVFIER